MNDDLRWGAFISTSSLADSCFFRVLFNLIICGFILFVRNLFNLIVRSFIFFSDKLFNFIARGLFNSLFRVFLNTFIKLIFFIYLKIFPIPIPPLHIYTGTISGNVLNVLKMCSALFQIRCTYFWLLVTTINMFSHALVYGTYCFYLRFVYFHNLFHLTYGRIRWRACIVIIWMKEVFNMDGNYRVITLIFKKYGNLRLSLEKYALFLLPPIFTNFLI